MKTCILNNEKTVVLVLHALHVLFAIFLYILQPLSSDQRLEMTCWQLFEHREHL